ncbi:type II toxin-antitoxin system RelE family toxin [Oceanidesulfovibrio marinus]|uniref:Type II toxin-antitoxin system RelE/ParE family toxin n=1 Tax=Oceanidesulfovibrio marinus TaxID=370038 RepID=A0ABX6NI54_9BACT|nr:type II toxin-antitoxin system RelE/ParE family toxin [Oceanidesulfovibrio marinus]QJT10243.1 type II toxin-antitoxin system RelE/ParE family toxin [Oceanidesulfovibrio marinus]
MNEIEWTQRARRQFRRIDATQRTAIRNAVGELANWPDCRNVRNLVGREGYRLRVGRYRVLFTIHENGEVRIVRIEEVKKRDDRTY